MNCLSRRAWLRGTGSAGSVVAAIFVVYLSAGAAAAEPGPGEPTPTYATTADPEDAGSDPEDSSDDMADTAVGTEPSDAVRVVESVGDEQPSIVFTGGAMAPLVCSSTPSTSELTINEATRITLANLTGATASVDTGTPGGAAAVTIDDGLGVSVRFRPGRYTVRMVPNCTMTNAVDAATLTVTKNPLSEPTPTGQPDSTDTSPNPTPHILEGPEITRQPRATSTTDGTPTHPTGPPMTGGSAPTPVHTPIRTPTARPSLGPATGSVLTSPSRAPVGEAGVPSRSPSSPPGVVALPDGPEQVIYDIQLVPIQQPGDARDSRLLGILAVICVFGVTTAIIRAILTQRARGMVRT